MPARLDYRWVVGALVLLALGYVMIQGQADPVDEARATAMLPESGAPEYDIVTLLPRDAIPAIDNPRFYTAAEADAEYGPDELVLGVTLEGESRAYSTSHLDRHEIVNDTVGGRKIAVTW